MSGENESFLARWSRRKADQQATDEATDKATGLAANQAADKPADEASNQPPSEPEGEPFDLSKLPSIESLGKDSDYSMFMHKAVPEDLRLKAIRRMWQTDPSIAGPDLLDMHAWDYTGTEGLKPLVAPAVEAVVTAAKEFLDRAQDKPAAAPPGESPEGEKTAAAPPAMPKDEGRG